MASPVHFDVLLLPNLIFDKIMLDIAIESLKSLHSCRQVCKGWDERISRNILKNQSRRQILRAMNWGLREFPSDEDIVHVKWLGKLFFNVKFLY